MTDKPKDEEFSLTLTGFKSKEQAAEFLSWYGEQGEQDITVWLECQTGMSTYMNVDNRADKSWEGNNLTARLKMET